MYACLIQAHVSLLLAWEPYRSLLCEVASGVCVGQSSSGGWADSQVQLHPTHLPLLLHLGDCLAAARAVEAAAAQPVGALDRGGAPDQAPASRSFIEGVFVPDTTAFATEFIARSWGYGEAGGGGGKTLNPDNVEGAPGGASVFVDAHSVLGSFRSGFSSFAAATAASLRESVPRPLAAWGGPGSGADAAPPEEGGAGGGWQLRVQTQDLSLVLWYPDAPDVPGLQARSAAC